MKLTTTRASQNAVAVHVRWAVNRDVERIREIDTACLDGQLLAAGRTLRDVGRLRVTFVAAVDDQVVGYMLYELNRKRIRLMRIAVDPAWRSRGVGTTMLDRVKSKLHSLGRDRIHVEVPVDNIEALQFFLAQGFESLFRVPGVTGVPDSCRLLRYSYMPQVEQEKPKRLSMWQHFMNFVFGPVHE